MLDSLLDALGYAGSVLDKPGRAVRGLLSGKLDEGLAALPFSDTMGVTDPGRRTSGRELLDHLGVAPEGTAGDLAGFGAELATDPMMYAGAGLGRMLGRNAEAAAVARGPRYGTTAEDLTKMLTEHEGTVALGTDPATAGRRVMNILKYPESQRLLSEIPEGSQILGAGAEGLAMNTPAGDVLRIGRTLGETPGRPVSENVLQATRGVDVPHGPANWRVERMPKAGPVTDQGAATAAVDEALGGQGLKYADRNAGNLGMVGGRPAVIDPGAVEALPGFGGGFQPVAKAGEASRPMNALLDLLGGDQMIRSAVESGRAGPALARKLAGYGGFAGADLGMYGRTQSGR